MYFLNIKYFNISILITIVFAIIFSNNAILLVSVLFGIGLMPYVFSSKYMLVKDSYFTVNGELFYYDNILWFEKQKKNKIKFKLKNSLIYKDNVYNLSFYSTKPVNVLSDKILNKRNELKNIKEAS